MLKQRIVTAIILIPLALLLLFYSSPPVFCILTALIMLWGAWEWSYLMQIQDQVWRLVYVFIVTLSVFFALWIPVPLVLMVAFVFWLFAAMFVICYPKGRYFWGGRLRSLRGVMGVLVLIPCWAAINFLRNADGGDGLFALLFLLVLIWTADITAYFVGRKWGKHKLLPHVSPGKSIEGMIGALIATLMVVLIMFFILGTPRHMWLWGAGLAVATVLFSILGDLFESMVKREAGVKDSGQCLPGHGGLLDRIDSLTAAAPVFTLGVILLHAYL